MPAVRVFDFHDDPSHGWLEVTFGTLRQNAFKPGDFTEYSYVDPDAGLAWLEQDYDAPKFLRVFVERGRKLALREHIWPIHAPIRNKLRLCPHWTQWPDRMLPYLEERAAKVIEYEAKYGNVKREAIRTTMKTLKKIRAMRADLGLPEHNDNDLHR